MPNRTDLQSAPGPDEGEIAVVDFDRIDDGPRNPFPRTCQECGGSVPRDEPHVRANILLYTPPVMQTEWRLAVAYFCDRECWSAWASRPE
jgi:hypothetical protein